MAATLVQFVGNTAVAGTTVAVTIAANVAGNLIAVACANRDTLTVVSVTDNATGGSNTYTAVPGAVSSNGARSTDIWRCLNPTHAGATTVTVTFSGTIVNVAAAMVYEVSGIPAVIDDGANNAAAATQSPVGPSVTTTSTNGFVLAVFITNASITENPTAGNEFISGDITNAGADATASCSLLSTTAAAHAPAWTTNAAIVWAASTAAFGPTPAVLDETAYRWHNDNGTETTATWAANENTQLSAGKNTNYRPRLQLNATRDPVSQAYQIEYRKQGFTTWHKVGA